MLWPGIPHRSLSPDEIRRLEPKGPTGFGVRGNKYRGEEVDWYYHEVVEYEGRVYDAFGPRNGVPVDDWKGLWDDAEIVDFGGLGG